MDLVEEAREDTVVGSPQAPALVTPAAPTVSENLKELVTRAVATAIAPMDALLKALQTEITAMKNLDKTDGLGDTRHTLYTVGWIDCAAMVAERTPKESLPATTHDHAWLESRIGCRACGTYFLTSHFVVSAVVAQLW